MSRRHVIATAVLALALAGSAACAQPTAGTPAPAPAALASATRAPAAGGDNAAFCAALVDAQGTLTEVQSAITGESDPAQLKLAGDKIQELAALAPPEIASDLQAVADGFHAGAAGAATEEVGQQIIVAFVRVSQELPRICS